MRQLLHTKQNAYQLGTYHLRDIPLGTKADRLFSRAITWLVQYINEIWLHYGEKLLGQLSHVPVGIVTKYILQRQNDFGDWLSPRIWRFPTLLPRQRHNIKMRLSAARSTYLVKMRT